MLKMLFALRLSIVLVVIVALTSCPMWCSTSRLHHHHRRGGGASASVSARRYHNSGGAASVSARRHHHPRADELFSAAGGSSCAAIPPALWCGCDKLEEKCGSAALCNAYAGAVRHEPLHITLLYESLCPQCQQLITKPGGLFDMYQKFKQHIRVELVPYGNAQVAENGTIECQHGEEECRINKFQSCAISAMLDPFPFIYCLESLISAGAELEKAAKKCYDKLHTIPHIYDQITHCFNGPKGNALQMEAAQKTQDIWPDQHEFVPWILVNNASLQAGQFLQDGLQTLICLSRLGIGDIPECMLP